MRLIYLLPLVFIFISACQPTTKSDFTHEVTSGSKPWTHTNFDAAADKFTFAIFSDLTGGERDRIFEVAVAQINLLRPEFVMNVGDLIEGANNETEWNEQWDSFDARAERAIAPVFYTGGNHDLTGVLAQEIWEERLGARYYHFIYKDVLFLVLDTEDHTADRMAEIEQIRNDAMRVIDTAGWEAFPQTDYYSLPERSTGNLGAAQIDYFLQVIQENAAVRHVFLFMHKPIWEREGNEQFGQIEEALAGREYTVFHGHTHVYKHTERNGHDYINLATTGGVQLPEEGRSMDQVVLVTVDEEVSIANVLMEGILDKTGHVPLDGDTLVFEQEVAE
ncbi:metallophosphoesterase family protein [Marinoscillum sp.]|uniref:metallophosphoesterase family protein n=1 Tax=Marinoscillum sp. TaxID=2024838 RepID=UPI003BAD9B7E